MVGIYKITSPSGSVYIGQSHNIEKRWKSYKYVRCREQPKLYNSLLKYGAETHKFEVIHELPKDITQDILNNYEIIYWKFYRDLLFRMLNTRDPGSRGKHSEETKPLFKNRVAWNKGGTLTEEHKKRCSESLKGKIYSQQRRNKISAKLKGSKGPIKAILQFDMDGGFIKEWESVTLASKIIGIPRTTISDCLNGRVKYPKAGFLWKYKKY